jgi:hypothetical protein
MGRLQGKLLDEMDEMSVRDDFRGSYFLPLLYVILGHIIWFVNKCSQINAILVLQNLVLVVVVFTLSKNWRSTPTI